MRTFASVVTILAALFALGAAEANVPLLDDGTVNLGRLPGEKGVWELTYLENMAGYIVSAHAKDRGVVPFRPWAAALYNYNVATEAKYDPEGYCLPPGGPRLFTAPYPMEIVQLPDQKRVFILFEVSNIWREVYMDGRSHPVTKNGTWLGHSVGHYEDGGKTLSVDVADFNEGTWLDFAGHPHTNKLHVVEKFTRPTRNMLHYEAVIDDPGAYTRPWTVAWNIKWWPDGHLDQYVCEKNKWAETLKDDFGIPMFPAK